ncbi:MAG: type II 3-dehydroquinate dehydratase [Chloroflexi bacterium]|nr:type II 3-dehydroquinate dehydratase [Chloroflexota bacterium]
MFKILLIQGPNLNLLGVREPGIYGTVSFDEINNRVVKAGQENGAEVRVFHSNSEGGIVDAIQEARNWADGIILNPGAYAHYSIAIRDALSAVKLPAVEVHLTNVHARDEFRHRLVISPVCVGVIAGLGWRGYIYALHALLGVLQDQGKAENELGYDD